MQIVSYYTLRALWAEWCGLDLATLPTLEAAGFNRAVNRVLRRGWEWTWWPDLMRCEERRFRATYASGTAYAAPTATTASEVYFPATRKYYQALVATTGNAPATLSGTTYTTQAAYWAECATSYSAVDWADATVYAVGDQRRNPDDDRIYQCHTAHTSSGSLDSTKFGILTPFLPYVGWEQTGETALGTIREVWAENPRTYANRARPLRWEPDHLGVRCIELALPDRVFIEFRRRCPVWSGATWSAGVLTSGLTRYYSSSTAGYEGDYWTTNTTTLSGDSPEVAPTKWDKVEIPAFLCDFAAQGAAIARLQGEGQLEKALAENQSRLWPLLYDEADKLGPALTYRPRRARMANL